MSAPRPESELARLAALTSFGILDTPPEAAYDDLVALAAELCEVPIALVNLVDADRQWTKAGIGLHPGEVPRDQTFCTYALLQPEAVMVVPDAQRDPRFAHNPFVTSEPHIRFYAGAPLVTGDGQTLGTLCVIDHQPRELRPSQLRALRILARQVVALFELHRQRLRLEEHERFLQAVLDTLGEGVLIRDTEQRLVLYNASAARILEAPLAEFLGQPYSLPMFTLLRGDGSVMAAEELPSYRTLETGEPQRDVPFRIRRPDGSAFWMETNTRPLLQDGKLQAVVVSFRDITARKAAEQGLSESEARFRATAESMLDALFVLQSVRGPDGGVGDFRFVYLNPAAERLTGLLTSDVAGKTLLHYLPRSIIGPLLDSYAQVAETGKVLEEERQIELPGDASIWLEHQAVKLQDGVVVAVQDISRRKRIEAALARSEQELRTITDNVPALILYVDQQQVLRFCNRAVSQWYGKPMSQLVDQPLPAMLGEAEYALHREFVERALAGERVDFELWTGLEGRQGYMKSTYIPEVGADGQVDGFYAVTHDVTNMKQLEMALTREARYDPLTGLPNRKEFMARLERALSRANRQGISVAVGFLDIDRFKQINDTYGHATGDAVLREFGQRLIEVLRKTDLAARLAGDEFTVIIEGFAGMEELEIVARKIVIAMHPPFAISPGPSRVTTSLGLARAEKGLTADALLLEADKALYQAKRLGRDTFFICG